MESEDNDKRWWIITEKAAPGFSPDREYQVRLTVDEGGAMDYAGNEFDAVPGGSRQNIITWTFTVSSDGTPNVANTEYAP